MPGERVKFEKLPRGRHQLGRQFVIHSQRERLLAAMADAVAENGYNDLKVREVVERAGVSSKTFYEHFKDKEACFIAAYDAVVEQLITEVADAFGRGRHWRERLRLGLDAFLGFLAAEPAFARMCIVEVLAAGPAAVRRRDEAMASFHAFFEPVRSEGPQDLPQIVPEAIIGGVYEIVYARVLQDQCEDLPKLRPQLMYWFLVPYVGHREAAKELQSSSSSRRKASSR